MCIYIFKMHTFILRIYICGIQLQAIVDKHIKREELVGVTSKVN